MFTGIIEEIGAIRSIIPRGPGLQLEISAQKVLTDLEIDQSIAVNGVCLTVVNLSKNSFMVDAVSETLSKSTLAHCQKNDLVNLERALRLQDRLGGHLVQGHVDGIGNIKHIAHQVHGSTLIIEIPNHLERYTISKGSIAIDGISLTIAEKNGSDLKLAVIPHTLQHTILKNKKSGNEVNIEVDFMAKYIEQFLNGKNESKISEEWLKQKGFY